MDMNVVQLAKALDSHQLRRDNVELELAVRLLGADEVSDVWRVERATEEADPQACAYSFICPSPWATHLNEHSSRVPIGPRACSFCVELPISAPIPNSAPSVNRVDALT